MPVPARLAALLPRLQGLLPQHSLTRCAGWFTRSRLPPLKNALIRIVGRRYAVNWDEAAGASPRDYASFNAFFTRSLKAGARPVDAGPGDIVCPCDGRVSTCGPIDSGTLLQAKGHRYSLAALLGGEADAAADYATGRFITVYLAPGDYHRVHAPIDATLESILHVPGRLFAVGAASARHIPGLFARNERLVLRMRDVRGRPAALVLVGAMLAGGLESVFTGPIPHRAGGSARQFPVPGGRTAIRPGQELGRFNLGSTVIFATAAGDARLDAGLHAGARMRMGQHLGRL